MGIVSLLVHLVLGPNAWVRHEHQMHQWWWAETNTDSAAIIGCDKLRCLGVFVVATVR